MQLHSKERGLQFQPFKRTCQSICKSPNISVAFVWSLPEMSRYNASREKWYEQVRTCKHHFLDVRKIEEKKKKLGEAAEGLGAAVMPAVLLCDSESATFENVRVQVSQPRGHFQSFGRPTSQATFQRHTASQQGRMKTLVKQAFRARLPFFP